MKKFNLFSSAFVAALMLASCSAEDAIVDNGGTKSNESSYLAIQISSVGTSATRAEDYDPTGGSNKDYVDGDETEGKINKVWFYFFDANGKSFPIVGQQGNKIEKTSSDFTTDSNGNESETVETTTNAIVLIDGQNGEKPSSLIAVVNPDAVETGILSEKMDKSTLTTALLGATNNCNTKDGGFVMTNSVYLDNGNLVNGTDITGHTYSTDTEAKNDPVDIYVERVNAKVVAFKGESGWITATIDNQTYDAYQIDATNDVYAVVQGWGTADEATMSNLVKSISTTWMSSDLGINPWSTKDYHRSFWATSVPFGDNHTIGNHKASDFKAKFGEAVYTQENTPTATTDFTNLYANNLTKVLVVAKLMKRDDSGNFTAYEYAVWRGQKIGNGLTGVQTAIANAYGKKYYKQTSSTDNSYTYSSLEPSDFVVESNNGTYVTFTLKSDVDLYSAPATYTPGSGNTHASTTQWTKASDDEVNAFKALIAREKAQIATEGWTYYYAPISHLSTTPETVGQYGVVRNHVYRITINSIAGYGTPIYNPDSSTEVIDPETPEETSTYLYAKMNVLSWRIVKSSVDLNATEKK